MKTAIPAGAQEVPVKIGLRSEGAVIQFRSIRIKESKVPPSTAGRRRRGCRSGGPTG